MSKKFIAVAALAMFASSAFAQDGQSCATPITIQPAQAGTTISVDTTASANSIGALGGLPSPGNDMIYAFTWSASAPAGGLVQVSGANYDFGVFLVPTCSGGTTGSPLQAATGPGATGSFPLTGLTDATQYFIVVSGDPAVNSPLNGTLSFVMPPFPVSLQSFSIE
jgi:hypothetical protein